MFGVDDLLTGGLSLLSGVTNNLFAGKRQDDAQAFNAQQAAANREWQQYMSNTSHQREADDLEKAGLNRILSLGKGASSPGGSSAASSPGAPVHDMLGPAVTTAMAHSRLKQELENMKAENDRIMKDTRLKVVQGNTEDERTRTQAAETLRTLSDTHLKDTHTKHTAQEIVKGTADAARSVIDTNQLGSPAMKVLRETGNIGHEVQRASSALGNVPALINAGRGRIKAEDFEETTYHPKGDVTIKTKQHKGRK